MGEAVVEFRPAVDGDGVALEGGDGVDEGGAEAIRHEGDFSRARSRHDCTRGGCERGDSADSLRAIPRGGRAAGSSVEDDADAGFGLACGCAER